MVSVQVAEMEEEEEVLVVVVVVVMAVNVFSLLSVTAHASRDCLKYLPYVWESN